MREHAVADRLEGMLRITTPILPFWGKVIIITIIIIVFSIKIIISATSDINKINMISAPTPLIIPDVTLSMTLSKGLEKAIPELLSVID